MKSHLVVAVTLFCGSIAVPAPIQRVPSLRILQSNDDGWAEANARALFSRLTSAGHNVILSAPSLDRSGSGSTDITPKPLPKYHGCEYSSCPPLSPAIVTNASNTRLNYVNSYPVTSVRIGLQQIAPTLWNTTAPADLVVSGVNVGYNLGWQVYGSGTDNVAMYAAKHGIPALAFSGHEGARVGWNHAVPKHSLVYAELAKKLVETLVRGGEPFLPPNVWLNVNFPKIKGKCTGAENLRFVLTKIDFSVQLETGLEVLSPDVQVCGNGGRLPLEDWVMKHHEKECVVSVSVGKVGGAGLNAGKEEQSVVAQKLGSVLTCLGR